MNNDDKIRENNWIVSIERLFTDGGIKEYGTTFLQKPLVVRVANRLRQNKYKCTITEITRENMQFHHAYHMERSKQQSHCLKMVLNEQSKINKS